MKKILLIVFILSFINYSKSQTVVINDRLLSQLTKNQAARVASEKSFISSYEKQKEIYDKARNKVAQILAIHEFIYQQLHNINSLFDQGVKLKYIYQDLKIIADNSAKILQLTVKYPQYQVFLIKEYEGIITQSIGLKKSIEDIVLKKDKKILMNAYERDELLEEIRIQVYSIRGYTYYIVWYLENAKKKPYLLHIPAIEWYVDLDKMIVRDIIMNYKYL